MDWKKVKLCFITLHSSVSDLSDSWTLGGVVPSVPRVGQKRLLNFYFIANSKLIPSVV